MVYLPRTDGEIDSFDAERALIKVRKLNFNYLCCKYGVDPNSLKLGDKVYLLFYNPYLKTPLKIKKIMFRKKIIDKHNNIWYQYNRISEPLCNNRAVEKDRFPKYWCFLEDNINIYKDLFKD